METEQFVVELDGRRVLVDRKRQRVCVLDADGREGLCDRIQVAAGSVQGVFAMLDGVAGAKGV